MRYPEAAKLDIVEELAGHKVADPYRWLEDHEDPEVRRWLAEQAELYASHLGRWTERDRIRERLEVLTPGSVGLPRVRGERIFLPRRQKGQDQAVWMAIDPSGAERVVLDPADLSDDGTVVLQWASPSMDGRHLAYAVDEGGREEVIVRIIEVETGADVGPPLQLGRGGAVAWMEGSSGLVLVSTLPDLPKEEAAFHRRVWRLPLGAGREDAELLFGEGRDRTTYYGVGVSADGRWLTVSCSLGTAPRNDLYLCDLLEPELTFRPVLEGVDAEAGGQVAADGRLWLWTSVEAPRGRLVTADPLSPTDWHEVVPEGPDPLSDWQLTDSALFVAWQRDVASAITVHDRATGAQVGEVALPGLGS
ncbi:MAG: hypothetical protein WKF86_07180, partial [Acidimicrobiales bacterium]